jgi:outer membrane protein OmpA-like peptidoglycan-associated protein
MQRLKKGLEPGVGHPSGLCARYKHLSPQGKEHLRVSASFSVAKSGRRGDRSRGKRMKRSYATLIFALLGLGTLTVLPAALHAQVVLDCSADRVCSAEDMIQALLPPAGQTTRGIGKIEGKPTKIEERPTVILRVQFATNSAVIPPPYHALLRELGEALTGPELSPYRFEIQGHTDNVGSDQLNERLSQKRAESVKRYLLQSFAVPPERLTVTGYGKKEPMAPNNTLEGRSKNRRVQIVNLGQ